MFHIFGRIFHGSQKGSFGKRQGRLGFSLCNFCFRKHYFLALGKFREVPFHLVFSAGDSIPGQFLIFFRQDSGFCLDAFDFLPAGFLNYFPFYRKAFPLAEHRNFRLLVFTGRQQGCEEPGNYQFINFALPILQLAEADALFRGDDGVVVGYLFVIYKGFAAFNWGF